MQLEKRYLDSLFHTVNGTEGQLTLPEARIRDRFMKVVIAETQAFEAERKTIYEKFCDKTEEGAPDINDNQYHFKKEIVDELNAELEVLLKEEVAIDVPEGVKEIVEKSAYKPRVGESESIDHILSLI